MSSKTAELVAHELGHIFLHRATGGVRVPRWFDEGFAQWSTGPTRFEQSTRLAMAFMFGTTIPLSALDDVNAWDEDRAELAYAESRAAFDYLMDMGISPEYIFAQIRSAGDFYDGFRNASGITVFQFYTLWAQEGARKFNYFILLADWRFTFLALTILFVIFGSIKLIRIRIAEGKADEIGS
ncbi:MAG TPA: hypothetical protein ENN07_05085 [candidate division Zixibacteria bacterium]|nr:hypothetical protein [candidate division Zixibacteria bacterium]